MDRHGALRAPRDDKGKNILDVEIRGLSLRLGVSVVNSEDLSFVDAAEQPESDPEENQIGQPEQ